MLGRGEWLPSTLLASLAGLQIELAKDRLNKRKPGFNYLHEHRSQMVEASLSLMSKVSPQLLGHDGDEL